MLTGVLACALILPAAASAAGSAVISNLSWGQSYGRPGGNLTASFTSAGSATISFSIRNAAGRLIRDLGDDVPVSPGLHLVSWDGYTGAIRPVRDGVYTLLLTSPDPGALSGTTSTPIVFDSQGPTIRIKTVLLKRKSSLVVFLSDNLSGVSRATLIIDRHIVKRIGGGPTRFSYRPAGGFARGNHPVAVYARDRANNQSHVDSELAVR